MKEFRGVGWDVVRGGRRADGDVSFRVVDLDQPDTVADALNGCELVVNTVPDRRLTAERIVLQRGGVLINISALPAAAGRGLRAVAGYARGTVVMNAGLAPGATNLLAADLLVAHPAADEVEMVFTHSAVAGGGPASAAFLRRGLSGVDRHRTAVIALPGPFGECRCLGFAEADAGWLGGIAEGRVIRSYIRIFEPEQHRALLALNRAGAMTTLGPCPFDLKASSRSADLCDAPVAHWVAVRRKRRLLRAFTIECRGAFPHAARSALVFAEALCDRPSRLGCFDPEEMFAFRELEPGLRAAGIRIGSHSGEPRAAQATADRS